MAANFDLSAMQLVAQHRRVAVDHCVEALAHSCLCADAYCRLPACPKMKRVVIHTNICQRKYKGSCPVCKQLIALCCYHAKNCKDTRCVVPFCNMVKQKMRRQRVYERLRTARGLEPDEPDEIDVNMVSGVSGWTWRMVRIVPNRKENSADDEDQAVQEVNGDDQANHEDEGKDQAEFKNNDEDQIVRDDDDEDQAMREVESPTGNDSSDSNSPADNNNVGENDTSDTSSDEGSNENEQPDTSSSDDNPATLTTEEKSESTEFE